MINNNENNDDDSSIESINIDAAAAAAADAAANEPEQDAFKSIFATAAAAAAGSPIETSVISTPLEKSNKYRKKLQDPAETIVETNILQIDNFLEDEITKTRNETWNKLDKGSKIQKLHAYAEKYITENKLPAKDIRTLKSFFSDCVNKNKLQKAKEVVYDKATGAITNIPSLVFSPAAKTFTLKNLDKRTSTLKSLTPKKISVPAAAADAT